jgi:dolichol kinase
MLPMYDGAGEEAVICVLLWSKPVYQTYISVSLMSLPLMLIYWRYTQQISFVVNFFACVLLVNQKYFFKCFPLAEVF